MNVNKLDHPRLFSFIFLLLVISYFAQAPAIRTGSPSAAGPLGILAIMWAPGLAAIITKLIFDRNLRGMGWGIGLPRFQLIAYAVPIAICLVVYGLVWQSGLAPRDVDAFRSLVEKEFSLGFSMPTAIFVLALASLGFLLNCVAVVGEEIGWRGYLLPLLSSRLALWKSSLIVGLIWAVWHFPGIIWGGYSNDGPLIYSLACFTGMLVGLSIIAGYLWAKTKSVWTAVVLHASHNLFIQAIFDPMTQDTPSKAYLLTEWGLGISGGYLLVGLALLGLSWQGPGNSASTSDR